MLSHYSKSEGDRQIENRQARQSVSVAAPGGLSTVHNSPSAKAIFWKGGSLVRAKRTPIKGYSAGPGGKRGKAQFSKASRRRLMQTVARTRRENLGHFVTLTYPGVYPHDSRTWKRHLDMFLKRLGRRFHNASGIWKLEPQKRGAPHYHLIVWGVDYVELLLWVGQNWYEVVGSGDERHLRAGTRVEKVRSWRGVMSYASKYLGKLPEPVDCPELWREVGRYWGVFARRNVPWAEMVACEVTERQAIQFIRYLRRYGHIRGRAYRSLSVICDSQFWFDRLDRLL